MHVPLIDIKNLSKKFGKQTWALKDLTLSIPQNSIFGIIGLSGAGKSTLLRCLTGLEAPTSGSIFLNGEEISFNDPAQLFRLRQEMGMVFQHFQLFSSKTAAENIGFPLEVRGFSSSEQKERVNELLNLVGLENKANHYPSQLSGGEKQRIGIARALAHHPKLLLCDEPTSALDNKTTNSILDLLQKLNQTLGLTVVLITHQLDTVKQICQRVAVLSHGAIVEENSVIDLFTQPKHSITQHLVHKDGDYIPPDFLANQGPTRQFLRISFKGGQAKQPILSYIIKHFEIEANILSGHLDHIQDQVIGYLMVELQGSPQNIQQAMQFLRRENIGYEVIV